MPLADPARIEAGAAPAASSCASGSKPDRRRAASAASAAAPPAALRLRLGRHRHRGGGRGRWRSSSSAAAAAARSRAAHRLRRAAGGIQIDAALQPHAFGTEIHMYVKGVRSGTLCRVFLRGKDGAAIGRQLPLPLGRRLRRGPQLGAGSVPHPGDRRPRRRPHLRSTGRQGSRDRFRLATERGGIDVNRKIRHSRLAAAGARGPGARRLRRRLRLEQAAPPAESTPATPTTAAPSAAPTPKKAPPSSRSASAPARHGPGRLERDDALRIPQGQGHRIGLLRRMREAWPPLLTKGEPQAVERRRRLAAGDDRTQRRDAGDLRRPPALRLRRRQKPGEANGNDVEAFGAEWYALQGSGEEAEDNGGDEGSDDSGTTTSESSGGYTATRKAGAPPPWRNLPRLR